MKATLTIEVPDDFKKGEHELCPLSRPIAKSPYVVFLDGCKLTDGLCNADNCPLEIQEKTLDLCKTCTNIKYCGKRSGIGTVVACSDYIGE